MSKRKRARHRSQAGPERSEGPGSSQFTTPRTRRRTPWVVAASVATVIGAVLVLPKLWSTSQTPVPSNARQPGPERSEGVRTSQFPIPDPVTADTQPLVAELIQAARQAVQQDPTSAEAWGKLGAACDAHKLHDCAEVCYRRAHALAPDEFTFPYLLAQVLDITGSGGSESIALYRTAARLNVDYPPILWRLGVALQRQGRLPEARDAYVRATELDPRFAMGHRNAGQALLALGDVEGALHHLEAAARLAPGDGAVYAALAQAYRRLGDAERAKQAADRAREREPMYNVPDPVRDAVRAAAVDSSTAYERAKKLIHDGRHSDAIPYLKICETADPNDPIVHVFLATCYRRAGERDLAITHLSTALRLKEDTVSAHLEMATVLLEVGRLEQALDHYRRLQEYRPNNAGIHIWMADAFVREGYLDHAVGAFESAAERKPTDAQTHVRWGAVLLDLGDLDGAIEHQREAILLNPAYAAAYFNLGAALEEAGQPDQAIVAYRNAVRIDSDSPAAQRLVYLEAGVP